MVTRRAGWIAALLIVLACARIAATFRVFSDTADEANHVKAGLEIYQFHRYVVQTWNPPLPRLVISLAPYLGGMRYDPTIKDFTEGLRFVLVGHGEYKQNLVRARAGNVLFFALAAVAVWMLARRVLDEAGALVALLLFTAQPVILGYFGLATHDGPAVTGVAVALLAFMRWLDAPDWKNASLLGIAYGFAALCKFSCIAFVPAACAAIAVVRLLRRELAWRALVTIAAVPLAAFVTIWAGYGFSVGRFGRFAHLPAPQFFDGVFGILQVDREGFESYAWNHVTTTGWWWYFPFTLLVKTTLAALILFAVSAFTRRAEWALATAAMVVPALSSTLDIGVRYILPVYVPLSIAAAAAALVLLRSERKPLRWAAMALLAWHVIASAVAHPDYFPYFNEAFARAPSRYLADSNLDWGQDLLRLRGYCRRNGIAVLPRAVFGDKSDIGLPPPGADIDWTRPPTGPTAVSESVVVTARAKGWLAFRWADDLPYARVGQSIRVYGVTSP